MLSRAESILTVVLSNQLKSKKEKFQQIIHSLIPVQKQVLCNFDFTGSISLSIDSFFYYKLLYCQVLKVAHNTLDIPSLA